MFNNALRYRAADDPGQTYFTPQYVLDPVRSDMGGIDLDPCTTVDNPVGAATFYTIEDDGLSQPWDGSAFVNPPYGKAREPWADKCIEAGRRGQRVVLLMPAATDTKVFQRAALSADVGVFVQGRLKFGTLRPNRRQIAASHPSVLLGWNMEFVATAELGMVFRGD